MHDIKVQIVRYVDDNQPGWVECELFDADGRRHLFIEKVPVVTLDDLRPDSQYPIPGIIRCEVLRKYGDERGRELVYVSTAKPWGIESKEGLSEFTVPANLVTPVPESTEPDLTRPDTKVPVEFASRVRIEKHSELAKDFVRRVLCLDWAWISDESSLWDFHTDKTNESLTETVRHIYGVDVSDILNGNLADIFDKISKYRPVPPGTFHHQ